MTRPLPPEAREALASVQHPKRRQYAAYLHSRGYTLAAIADATGVTRQAVSYQVGRVANPAPVPGLPVVPAIRKRALRSNPPLDRATRQHMLGLWYLSTRRRRQHDDDSPWAMASRDFVGEVRVLQAKGYSLTEIAHDLKVPADALYRRMQRAARRGEAA